MSLHDRTFLRELESHAIEIIREVAAQFVKPTLLFSGGKDSIVLAHLAKFAFAPAPVPFGLLHIDTGHNFPETLDFRDTLSQNLDLSLTIRKVEDSISAGRVHELPGHDPSRNTLQTVTLLDAIAELKIDAAIGGARRDEEKSRAKERIFSHRDRHGQWNARQQRPELWSMYNGLHKHGEHFRVFPLSDWTERDIWQFIKNRQIRVPSLYFAHRREVIRRNGMWLATYPGIVTLQDFESSEIRSVRFRTMGDISCTGAFPSHAANVDQILDELATLRASERSGRIDDQASDNAMEERKRQGYF